MVRRTLISTVVGLLLALATMTPAAAQVDSPPEVLGESVTAPQPEVQSGGLVRTGGDFGVEIAAGAVLIVAGAGLAVAARRRRTRFEHA